MKRVHPVVAQATLGVVAVLSLFCAFNNLHTVDQRNRHYQDPRQTYFIGMEQQQLRSLILMVPPQSVVGYVSDVPARSDPNWPTNSEFIFTAVRYALAPRLLVPYKDAVKPAWVVGEFSKPADLEQFEREHRLDLAKQLDSGVVLFRSK
jgi:hypothetical protein